MHDAQQFVIGGIIVLNENRHFCIVKQLNLIQNIYIFRLNVTILLPCERSFEIVK